MQRVHDAWPNGVGATMPRLYAQLSCRQCLLATLLSQYMTVALSYTQWTVATCPAISVRSYRDDGQIVGVERELLVLEAGGEIRQ